LTENIQVIDFGEAFFTKDPPTKMLNTPLNFLAPEALFELKASERSDDWALACLIYMIQAGKPLFQIAGFGTIDEYIPQLVQVLGPLPDEWQRIFFDEDGMPYRAEREDREPKHKNAPEEEEEDEGPEPLPVIELVRRIELENEDDVPETLKDGGGNATEIRTDNGHGAEIEGEEPATYSRPRDSKERDRWNYTEATDGENGHDETTEEGPPKKKKRTGRPRISEDETACLHDLLSKVIRYNPEERISTSQIASHEWFVRDFYDSKTQ
jgi:serine/threonine protein kinase